jgi:hypothetical protein
MHAKLSVLLTVVILVTWVPVNAHHSFAAVFDVETSVDVSGTVTKVEWMNPHAWIYIDVDNDDGGSNNWAFELGSPNGLMRRGWTRKTVQVGDAISVAGYRARDGSNRGNVKSIVLADGTELTGMSSRDK